MDGDTNHSPKMFTDYIYKWLDTALDFGISEADFWNMTFAELERLITSKRRMEKLRAQEKASFDYLLADLIGYSVARTQSSANRMPEISEVYPSLFDSKEVQEQKQIKRAELSALRFKQYANFHNNRFNKEVATVNE